MSHQTKPPPSQGDSRDNQEAQPYVAADRMLPEFTVRAAVAGILLGVLFGAANAYLGLRAGLTISTSIPVAVLTVAVFRLFERRSGSVSVLESNISQTIGSASSSVASGVIFTLPALFLWQLPPPLLQMVALALCGGLLGVFFMVPLRRFLIQQEHGRLPYPEGTACAEVLKASDSGGNQARPVFLGLGAGALFKFAVGWIHVLPDNLQVRIPWLPKGQIGMELSAALLGVGYILGPRIGAIMVAGGALSWIVIIPTIAAWGDSRVDPLYPETVKLIREMSSAEIWSRYVRYVGAGAVATGGLITLIRSAPTMIQSFRLAAEQFRNRKMAAARTVPRTGQDLSLGAVAAGVAVVAVAMVSLPPVFPVIESLLGQLVAAALVLVFGFFFVTVSARIVGMVGVTSNPTSGMTIATLLGSATLFLALGWTGDPGKVAALTVGCVVAIGVSIAGDTSQDLKTGYLLGATPRRQQIGELIGVATSATFVCMAVLLLHRSYGFGTQELPAPQATLMKVVIEGVLEQSLPWRLVLIGVGLAILAELFRIPSLPFAVGVYLPVSTMVTVFAGGALRAWLQKRASRVGQGQERGVLFGSGLVGGEGLLGVGIAGVAFLSGVAPRGVGFEWAGWLAPWLGFLLMAILILSFARIGKPQD